MTVTVDVYKSAESDGEFYRAFLKMYNHYTSQFDAGNWIEYIDYRSHVQENENIQQFMRVMSDYWFEEVASVSFATADNYLLFMLKWS